MPIGKYPNHVFQQPTTTSSFAYLVNEIAQWGMQKGIIQYSNSKAQASKTLEEVEELLEHTSQLRFLREVILPFLGDMGTSDPAVEKYITEGYERIEADLLHKLVDDYGDVFVTLVMGAEIEGIDLRASIAAAYDEIKDRKGEMRADGKFHKELTPIHFPG